MLKPTVLAITLAAALLLPSAPSLAATPRTVGIADTQVELPARLSHAESAAAAEAAHWAALDDPVLPDLIATALVANTDLRQALARLRVARHRQAASASNVLPQGGVQLGRESGDAASSRYAAGLALDWELDLFGRLADERQGARARHAGTAADLRGLQLVIAAEVARTWFQLQGAREAARARAHYAEAQDEVMALTAVRVVEGLAADADLARSRAEAAADAAETRVAQDRVFVLEARLATLLSEVAGHWRAPASPRLAPLHPRAIAVPEVSALLAARPDVQAAARRLEASGHDAEAAAAARFPRLSLVGVLSFLAGDAGSLFSGASRSNAQGGALTWSPFALPRLQADYRAAQAGTELALAEYDGSVLRAIEDAETALQRHGSANHQLQLRIEAARQSQVAASAAQARYEEGAAPYQDTLLARRDAIRMELASVEALVEQRNALVDVLRALGTAPASHAP